MEPIGRRLNFPPLKSALVLTLLFLTACSQTGPIPESPLLRALERKSGLIAYIGPDGNVHAMDQAAGNRIQITQNANVDDQSQTGREYYLPVWSPNAEWIAYAAVEVTSEMVLTYYFYVSELDSLEQIQIFSSSEEQPIDLYWSPNNEDVGIRTSNIATRQTLFRVVSASGSEQTDIGSGAIFYWDWAPDGLRAITHIGQFEEEGLVTEMEVVTVSGGVRHQPVGAFTPFRFFAPDWSPTGDQILFAAEDFDEGILYVSDPDGSRALELVFFRQFISFGWSPEGTHMAYIVNQSETPNTSGVHFGELAIIDMEDRGSPMFAPDSTVMAFFWSPDNKKLAYFRPAVPEGEQPQAGTPINFELKIMDVETGEVSLVETFVPADSLLEYLFTFDQFSRSSTLWSPDSENIIVTARDLRSDESIMLMVPASGGIASRILDVGAFATWSSE